MKKNILYASAISLSLLAGCNKLEIENPNGGTTPGFETAKEGAAYAYTGELARISSMLLQQLQGNDMHYQPIYDRYQLADLELQNTYNTSYRSGVSIAADANTDEGKFLEGAIYALMIEYFENAEKYVGRGLDPVALTYSDIHTILGTVGGDYTTVAKMVNARVYLNQGDYANALASIPAGLTVADGYTFIHSGTSTNMNEWPRFQNARSGYLSPDLNIFNITIDIPNYQFLNEDTISYYVQGSNIQIMPIDTILAGNTDTLTITLNNVDTLTLNGLMANDPRLSVYYNDGSLFDFPMARNEAYLIDYAEVKFIEAEAALETNDLGRAATAYVEGMTASFERAGVNGTAYIAAHSTLPIDKAQAKAMIMAQKYIHMFGHPQAFVDYRRTRLPAITEKNSSFPTKWHYYYQ